MTRKTQQFVPLVCTTNISAGNIADLTAKYNYVFQSELTNTNKQDADTLNRKSFYESQEYSTLIVWNFWILALYYILAIVLSIILFVSDNQFQLTTYQKGGATVMLLTYPYVINYLISPVVWVYRFVLSFMPNNVYNNL